MNQTLTQRHDMTESTRQSSAPNAEDQSIPTGDSAVIDEPSDCLGIFARKLLILALTVSILPARLSAQDGTGQTNEPAEKSETSVKPGINDSFVDPKLDVSEWLGRFEIESREVYSARERVLEVCEIKPGDAVADIGAGTGFYSRLFASAVGEEGWVFAVDISPRFLEHINLRSREEKVTNLTGVLCSDRSVRLPPASVDLAFICDTYHHFEYPQSTLASLHRAIKRGGVLVVIDFDRIPGKSRDFILGHVRAGKEVFRSEIEAAGFKFVDEVEVEEFEENYLLRFRRP